MDFWSPWGVGIHATSSSEEGGGPLEIGNLIFEAPDLTSQIPDLTSQTSDLRLETGRLKRIGDWRLDIAGFADTLNTPQRPPQAPAWWRI